MRSAHVTRIDIAARAEASGSGGRATSRAESSMVRKALIPAMAFGHRPAVRTPAPVTAFPKSR